MDIDPLPTILITLQSTIAMLGTGHIIALLCAVMALGISGFMSGSEIAYFSIDPDDDDAIDDLGNGEAVKRLLDKPEKLLATILICNNLVNVAIVVLCSYALSPLFTAMEPWLAFVLQTVLLTFLILLFGEIVPKLIANTCAMKWASAAAGSIGGLVKLFTPLSSMLVKSSGFVNRVVKRKAQNISTDDLSQALDITDVKTSDEKEMLEGILKFGDTTASEIMTPRVDITSIDIDMDFRQVMEVVVESGYSRLPVYGESQDDVRGILYSRDLLPYVGKKEMVDWTTLMRKPYFVPESRMIDDLLEDFRKLKIHLAVVVDEFGGTQGIVTLEDVLEEIVGDINDEYDEEEKTYRRLPDDTYIFEGKTLLTDFFRITGLDADDYAPVAEDCETLAGMLLAIKGDFPKDKEPLVYSRCRFLVLDVSHHRITSVRVKVMPEPQEQERK